MKIWVVDSIDKESNMVRLLADNGENVVVSVKLFEKIPAEGDVITISSDDAKKEERMKKVNSLIDELFE